MQVNQDGESIIEHDFFKEVSFEAVLAKKISCPFTIKKNCKEDQKTLDCSIGEGSLKNISEKTVDTFKDF